MFRLSIAAPVLALAPLAAVLAAPTPARHSLRSLALQPRDLPRGYTVTSQGYVSNRLAATTLRMTLVEVERRGRINSYQSVFRRATTREATLVEDQVVQYRAATGAHWAFGKAIASNQRAMSGQRTLTVTTITGLGNEARVYAYHLTSGKAVVRVASVVFRRGVYQSTVLGYTVNGTWSPADSIRLARIVDARLRHA